MKNKKIAIFLVIALVFAQIMPVHAATATGSNASVATSSDADEIIVEADAFNEELEFTEQYNNLMMFSSVAYSSDINETYVPYAMVVDSNGKWVTNVRGTYSELYSNDDYSVYTWPTRPEGTYYQSVYYQITKASGYLPSPGVYGLQWRFANADFSIDYTKAAVQVYASQSGVTTENINKIVTLDGSYAYANVEIGYQTNKIYLKTYFDNTSNLDVCVPNSNPYKFTFTLQDASTATSPEISAGNSGVNDVIANNTASMADTLKEIIVHISNQLAALWDQMYNYMHLPQLANDDKNTQLIIDTLTNGLSVEVENQDDNAQEIIQNQDENTETIVNGYDNSGMQSDQDQLDSAMSDLSEAEDVLFDASTELFDSVDFDHDMWSFSTFFHIIGSFLNELYNLSGSLQIFIDFSLLFVVISMAIGLYRFKG